MNKYETVIIISNKITKEQKNNVITKITNLISKNGEITEIKDLGEKNLAYEVKKHKQAFYYDIFFETSPEFIAELEHICRITDEILKFIVVRNDDQKGR